MLWTTSGGGDARGDRRRERGGWGRRRSARRELFREARAKDSQAHGRPLGTIGADVVDVLLYGVRELDHGRREGHARRDGVRGGGTDSVPDGVRGFAHESAVRVAVCAVELEVWTGKVVLHGGDVLHVLLRAVHGGFVSDARRLTPVRVGGDAGDDAPERSRGRHRRLHELDVFALLRRRRALG